MKGITKSKKSGVLNVRVAESEKQMITELAERAGISPSDFVRRSLKSSLDLIRLTNKAGLA